MQYPTIDIGDCVDDSVDGAGDAIEAGANHVTLITVPIVAFACVFEPELCGTAVLAGGAATVGANAYLELTQRCFDFWSKTLQDLLVSLAAGLPGGVFELTAVRFGPALSPVVRRVLQILLDGPGVGLEVVHGTRDE